MERKKSKAYETKLEPKKVKGYKLLGKRFKAKNEANNAIIEVHRKGFKSTRLCVINGDFVVQYGAYTQLVEAKANLAAVQAVGFNAYIEEITE